MAVKTITIDLEAYDALARRKREGQSFSDVIKAHFRGSGTGRDLLTAARAARVDVGTVKHIEAAVARRRRDRPRVPSL
jgi:predicted CopG family antitoxin